MRKSKCKSCDQLYGLIQQIREMNIMTLVEIKKKSTLKTSTLLLHVDAFNWIFRMDEIASLCDEADEK